MSQAGQLTIGIYLLIFIHNIDVKKLDDSPLSVNDVDQWVIARQKVIIFTAYMKQDCIFS